MKPICIGDDLYSRQPICETVQAAGGHFLFVAKPGSHPTLHDGLDGVKGDTAQSRSVAEAIASDERAKRHSGVADRITRVLDSTSNLNGNGKSDHHGIRVRDGSGGIIRRDPDRTLASLYLAKPVRNACREFVEEQFRADVLRAHRMEPRHRLLLVGPPGNGKTSLAKSLAYELALPLFTVRYDAVVTSYLGETAKRLQRLFDYVRTEPCVLFFDEFDAIGKERGDIHETGEIKRVVTTLLLLLDNLPSYCVFVGATNHPELLDRATWRRFQVRLELDHPTDEQMTAYFTDQLRRYDQKPCYSAKRLCEAIRSRNFSEAEDFFLDIRRHWILSQGPVSLRSIIDDRVNAWKGLLMSPEESSDNGRPTDTPIP